jgi:hypothetical protein
MKGSEQAAHCGETLVTVLMEDAKEEVRREALGAR